MQKYGFWHGKHRALLWVPALAGFAALLVFTVAAGLHQPPGQQVGTASAARAFVNPTTGELQAPSPAQLKQRATAYRSVTTTAVPQQAQVVHRNGATIVRLPDQTRTTLRVDEGVDGQLHFSHDSNDNHE